MVMLIAIKATEATNNVLRMSWLYTCISSAIMLQHTEFRTVLKIILLRFAP